MPVFTIPSPSGGIFTVVIKDASGSTVYSGTQGNAPFDPGITDAGDYEMLVTSDGNTNGWCFTIQACPCYIPFNVHIEDTGSGIRYAYMDFNIDPDTFCHFYMHVAFGNPGTTTFAYPLTVPDLASLTFVSTGVYRKQILLTPDAIFFTYQISNYPYGYDDRYVCEPTPTTVNYSCVAVDANSSGLRIVEDSGDYYIEIPFQNHCDDKTCETTTINYSQIVSGSLVPDVGTYTFTPDCTDFPSPTIMRFLVTPNISILSQIKYNVTLINCCGSTPFSNLNALCKAPTINTTLPFSIVIVKVGADYFCRISATFKDCGFSCDYINGRLFQTGTFSSGGHDTVLFSNIMVDCTAQVIDIPINPNLTDGSTEFLFYDIGSWNCCAQTVANGTITGAK